MQQVIGGGDLQYFQTQTQKLDQVKKQLDSNNVKDKFVGMKKVVAVRVIYNTAISRIIIIIIFLNF